MKSKIFILTALIFLSSVGNAEEAKPMYKFFGGYSLFRHEAKFDSLPGLSLANSDGNQDGKGYFLGFAYEIPLPYSMYFGLRCSFSHFDAEFEHQSEYSDLLAGGMLTNGNVAYNLRAKFSNINIMSYLKLYLIEGLAVSAGGFVAPFISKSYEQTESVTSEGAIFADTKSRERTKSGDFIGKKGVYGGLKFGVSYDIPISNLLAVTPELSYSLGMNNMLEQIDWKANSLNFGLSVCYALTPKSTKDTIEKREFVCDTLRIQCRDYKYETFSAGLADTVFSTTETADKFIKSRLIRRTDTLYQAVKYNLQLSSSADFVQVDLQDISQAFKIMNYVFFDENSEKPLSRYADFEEFAYDELKPNAVSLHENILNIIGYRMQKDKSGTITLQGSISKNEPNELAAKRCNAIKNYLVRKWKISDKRISISTQANRFTGYTANSDSALAEQQFVQIKAGNTTILDPIHFSNFNNISKIEPNELVFSTIGSNLDTITKWEFIAYQQNIELFHKVGKTALPESISVDFNLLAGEVDFTKPLEVTLAITNQNGAVTVESKEIAFKQNAPDAKTKRLALILFDIDDDRIPQVARVDVANFLKDIPPDASLKISGYSDILGDRAHNLQLSEKRVQSTLQLVKQLSPDTPIRSASSLGCDRFPPDVYSYRTPIERFLSRTVIIDIVY